MIASRVTRQTLLDAAMEIGVQVEMSSPLNKAQTRWRVKLYPETPQALYKPPCKRHRNLRLLDPNDYRYTCRCRRHPGEQGDSKYQRSSASMHGNERRVHAVCWHGFRDFFRAVYRHVPEARFVTAMDTWQNAADFEARFRESGHKNIGSQMCPVSAAEACRCPESGNVGFMTREEGQRRLAIDSARDEIQAWQSGESLPEPVSLTTDDMGTDDVLVRPDGIEVERWATYNKKMNDMLMGRSV